LLGSKVIVPLSPTMSTIISAGWRILPNRDTGETVAELTTREEVEFGFQETRTLNRREQCERTVTEPGRQQPKSIASVGGRNVSCKFNLCSQRCQRSSCRPKRRRDIPGTCRFLAPQVKLAMEIRYCLK